MKRSLTSQDIRKLKNQSSMGYFISIAVFILGTAVGITIYEAYVSASPGKFDYQADIAIGIAVLILSTLLFLRINQKYLTDIKNNEKIQKKEKIQDKKEKTDYYKTTITKNYNLVISGIDFNVSKTLFDSCAIGDQIILYYAPKSKFLLSIEKA